MSKLIKVKRPSDGKEASIPESELENYAKGGYLPTGAAGSSDNDEPKTIDEMTGKELIAYAAENEINLGGKTKKADVLALIKAAETDESGDDDESDDDETDEDSDEDEDEDDDFE